MSAASARCRPVLRRKDLKRRRRRVDHLRVTTPRSSALVPDPFDRLARRIGPPWPGRGLQAGTGLRLVRPLLLLLLAAAAVQSALHVVNVAFFDLSINRANAD